jgi:hypothetical protein
MQGRDLSADDFLDTPVEPWDRRGGWPVRLLDSCGNLVALGRPTGTPGALHPAIVLM